MKTFFIADMHFGHTNIIKYCNRPFNSTDEMDNIIIDNWNSTVKNNDVVWILGDISIYSRKRTSEILSKLNGIKKLIRGNHDNFTDEFYRSCGISFVSKYPVLLKKFFILSHAPIDIEDSSVVYNIYGHVHNNPDFLTETNNSRCVSVERCDYRPIEIDVFNKK